MIKKEILKQISGWKMGVEKRVFGHETVEQPGKV